MRALYRSAQALLHTQLPRAEKATSTDLVSSSLALQEDYLKTLQVQDIRAKETSVGYCEVHLRAHTVAKSAWGVLSVIHQMIDELACMRGGTRKSACF